ncbi:Uncharacterised protein [Legionella cincinnatiensis]|uniref:Uncharacterized protein n=1 Tax=Legionella cincinnatiensis TaxID=28085 RepID=A0A378IFJ3_9GAMM|nr:Uncharacterised protein [Legionella cincinnatiensis]
MYHLKRHTFLKLLIYSGDGMGLHFFNDWSIYATIIVT